MTRHARRYVGASREVEGVAGWQRNGMVLAAVSRWLQQANVSVFDHLNSPKPTK